MLSSLGMLFALLPSPLLLASRPVTITHGRAVPSMAGSSMEPDMDSLMARMQQVRDGVTDVRFVVMDSMVPGQRLSLTAPPQLVHLFTANDDSAIVILGRQGSNVAQHGVEVTLESVTAVPVSMVHPEGTADLVLNAGRLCEVVDLLDATPLWLGRRGRARWIELDDSTPEVDAGLLSRSEALEANVDEWIGLVRSTPGKASRGQVKSILDAVDALGPIPDADQPSKRALWVAGLINPPARQGVTTTDRLAVEVRPSVMRGRTAEVRISVVERALDSSIQRLRRLAGGDEKFSP